MPAGRLPGAVDSRLMTNITRALEDNASRAPERTAVTGSRVTLTWRELHDAVAALAARLQDTRTLGLLMEKSMWPGDPMTIQSKLMTL